MAIELEITTNAHLEGLKRAQEQLEALGRAGKTANQNFKWNNLDASMASIRRNFNTNALFPEKGLKSAQKAINDITNAMKGAEQTIGRGGFVGWLNPDGMSSTITKDLTKVQQHFSSLKDEMVAYYDTYAKATTKQQMVFDPKSFNAGLDKQAEAATMFGKEIDGIALKMQAIKEQGIRMVTKGGDPEQIKALSAQYQELSKQHDKLSAAANGTGTRIKNLIKNFVSAQLVVWGIRQAFTFLTTTIREASQAAAEAEQVSQKFMTVFDGMQKAIDSVDRLTSSFGLAKSSAKDIMSTIGDMASGLGATDAEAAAFAGTTAEFIQDLIAFKDVGGDVIEITKAFMSGAAGNNRNFRQWGSIVKEATVQARLHDKGLEKLTGSELEWAKAQERVKIVMEQQKNALGATRREWDMFLSVQRRYNEQSKQFSENLGKGINELILPIKKALLEFKQSLNIAYEARQNFLDGTDASTPLLLRIDTEQGKKDAVSAINDFMVSMPIRSLFPTKEDKLKDIEAAARAFGLSAKQVADLNIRNWETNDAYKEGIRLIDIRLAKEREEKGILSDKKAALAEYAQSLSSIVDQFSSVTGTASPVANKISGTMSRQSNSSIAALSLSDMFAQFKDKAPTDYADALDVALGIGDKDGLKEKQKKIQEAYGIINNALIKAVASGDKSMQVVYENFLKGLAQMYQEGLATTVGESVFGDPREIDEWTKRMKSADYERSSIYKYGEDMGKIYAQWNDALTEAEAKKKKAIIDGVSETDAEARRLILAKQINDYYQAEVDALSLQISKEAKITKEKERQAALENYMAALASAQSDIDNQNNTNLSTRRALARAWNETPQQSASFERSEAMENAKQTLLSLAVSLYDENRGLTVQAQKKIDDMRLKLTEEAELNYQQALKDARDASLQNIQSMWENVGDVGMFKGWSDTYRNIKAYAQTEAGGGLSEGDASSLASAKVFEAVILEFAKNVEAVDEIMSIVSIAFEELGPIVNDFLQPFIPIIRIIIGNLNMIVPVLNMLFPVIKGVAVAFTWVSTVASWVAKVIEYAAAKITFWTKSDDISWNEVNAVWQNGIDTTKEIWAMEINARAEYVADLTDAQKGEIDAYKEMYKQGMLSLTEYSSLAGTVTGRTHDKVKVTDIKTQGTTVNYGGITITVNGAEGSPEDIAQAIRAEIEKIERRNIA